MKKLSIEVTAFQDSPDQYTVAVHIGDELWDQVNPLSADQIEQGIRENIADWLKEAGSRP